MNQTLILRQHLLLMKICLASVCKEQATKKGSNLKRFENRFFLA